MPDQTKQGGFTLVEAVLVILVTGIVGAMVAVFMKSPVDAYFDTARRAGLADEADTAVRRITRDIRKALPNSVRQASNQCIEFIPTKTGGRYRAETNAAGLGDVLDFTATDTSFDMLGANPTAADQAIVANDIVAVYNLGIAGADAYAGDNTAAVSAAPGAGDLAGETKIPLGAGKQFPLESGSNRFHVIPGDETIVSYVCSGGALYRNTNYAYSSECPAPVPGTTPVLAGNVASCSFDYTGSDLRRNALVRISLALGDSEESVALYHEVHVNNTP